MSCSICWACPSGKASSMAKKSIVIRETRRKHKVQIRHRSPPVPAEVSAVSGDRVRLRLLEPARAVAPGQSGVMYRGDLVLGGGIIA